MIIGNNKIEFCAPRAKTCGEIFPAKTQLRLINIDCRNALDANLTRKDAAQPTRSRSKLESSAMKILFAEDALKRRNANCFDMVFIRPKRIVRHSDRRM